MQGSSSQPQPASPEAFQAASSWLSGTPAAANQPNETKLELYGLFKYVTTPGPPDGSRPSIFYPTPRAKYDAWAAQSAKYAAKDQNGAQAARIRYVEIAKHVGWAGEGLEEGEAEVDFEEDDTTSPEPSSSKGKAKDLGGMGPRVSVMAQANEEEDDPVDSKDSPIHDAVIDNSLTRLQTILKQNPEGVDTRDGYGNTALHLATDRGHTEIVRALLQAGADRNLQDEDEQTPLQIAETLERKEIIDLLKS